MIFLLKMMIFRSKLLVYQRVVTSMYLSSGTKKGYRTPKVDIEWRNSAKIWQRTMGIWGYPNFSPFGRAESRLQASCKPCVLRATGNMSWLKTYDPCKIPLFIHLPSSPPSFSVFITDWSSEITSSSTKLLAIILEIWWKTPEIHSVEPEKP